METKSSVRGFDGRVWKNICFNASRLASRNPLPGMSVEDYRQELALDLARRSDRYDSAKASFGTFADRIIRHCASSLSSLTGQQREERRHLSLDTPVGGGRGCHVDLRDLIADDAQAVDDDVAARIDVGRFVDGLTEPLLRCCNILLADSVVAGVRAAGIHRSTAYEQIANLRRNAIAFGLGIYFEPAPDSLDISPVCGEENATLNLGRGETPERQPMHKPPRPVLKITAAELRGWIASAEPGDILEYHRGALLVDRVPIGSRLAREDSKELDRVAHTAMALAVNGYAHLVQRRHGAGDYGYLIIATAKSPTGRAWAWATESAS